MKSALQTFLKITCTLVLAFFGAWAGDWLIAHYPIAERVRDVVALAGCAIGLVCLLCMLISGEWDHSKSDFDEWGL